ncbi:MAG: hypothetical protein Kow00121_57640 [Elainellaceae cyanobacterium]
MSEFDHKADQEKFDFADAADASFNTNDSNDLTGKSTGSSVQESDFEQALDSATADLLAEHNHAKPTSSGGSGGAPHIGLSAVDAREFDFGKIRQESNLSGNLGSNGDFLDPQGGANVVIGAKGNDVIVGTGEGFNTITTGTGKDMVILGKETTNRIFDFDPSQDTLGFTEDLNLDNIVIAQGKNPGKGGLDQPLDSENNTLIIDKETEHILAALTFVKSDALSDKNFVQVKNEALDKLPNENKFSTDQTAGDGGEQLNGTTGRDKMIGGAGNDYLYLGDDSFKFETARAESGADEFPFPNNSAGSSELNLELRQGVVTMSGSYKDFEGLPLFSDGVEEVAEGAVIPNGADPKALIENFLKVPEDVEGNPISGFHLHFSREKFADATVERYLTVDPTDDQSGVVSGRFALNREEQAALLAGNIYANLHSNIHPVGENRIELNTVKFV